MTKFDVRFDPKQRRLYWAMRGFWTMADVQAFAQAMRDTVAPLGPPPQHYDALCDSSDFPVQSREVSDALGQIEQAGRSMRSGRVAIIVSSVTNKLQAQRTLTGDDVHVFLDSAEATAWLDAGPTP